MKIKHDQKGFAVALLAFLLVAVVVVASVLVSNQLNNGQNTPKDSNTSKTHEPSKTKVELSPQEQLSNAFLAYYVSHKKYPAATTEGWNSFVQEITKNREANQAESDNPFMSPRTGKPYVFTVKDPVPGEIQYRFPATCAENDKDFAENSQFDNYAFRIYKEDGIICYGNL